LFSAAFGIHGDIEYFNFIVEIIFGLEIIFSKEKNSLNINIDFVTEYWGDDYFHPIRDIKKIAGRYLKGWFVFDILAVLPFANMLGKRYD